VEVNSCAQMGLKKEIDLVWRTFMNVKLLRSSEQLKFEWDAPKKGQGTVSLRDIKT